MLSGTFSYPRVTEESVCRNSKDYRFTEIGLYKIHSTSLMPEIPFEEAAITPYEIDKSIFINDEDTMPDFNDTIDMQNFLTTKYIGRAPLEWYKDGEYTKMGRKFVLICRNGNPNAKYRVFGTEDAIHSYNRGASENVKLPGGGEGE